MNFSEINKTITLPSSIQFDKPLWQETSVIIILCAIIIFTIVGNFLVILSVATYRPLRIVPNFFLVSLAVADLMLATIVLPFSLAYTASGKWFFGIRICQIWLFCDYLFCTASILNLCAIALDRYWAITDPINYAQKRTLKRVIIMIVMVWVISVIICLAPFFGWNDWPDTFTIDTPCTLTQNKGFMVWVSVVAFYIPLLIMIIMYIKIFFAIRRRLRERAKPLKMSQLKIGKTQIKKVNEDAQEISYSFSTEESTHDNDISSRDGSQKPESTSGVVEAYAPRTYSFFREKRKIFLSRERNAARTLGIIMGVFIVCWLPFYLFFTIIGYCSRDICPTPDKNLSEFIVWLGYFNSSFNPVIYTIFNRHFRRAFKKYFRCSRPISN